LLQRDTEHLGKLRVAIHHQVLLATQEPVFSVAQIPGNLEHPCFVGISSTTGEVYPPCRQLHGKEQVDGNQPALGPNLDRREVDGLVPVNRPKLGSQRRWQEPSL
jgi:hypothetical protein